MTIDVGTNHRHALQPAPSPLEGEGWGGGYKLAQAHTAYPPPCLSPSRGEGTLERMAPCLGKAFIVSVCEAVRREVA